MMIRFGARGLFLGSGEADVRGGLLKAAGHVCTDSDTVLMESRRFMDEFTHWYNHEHRHTGIGLRPR